MLSTPTLAMPESVRGLRILGFSDWYTPSASGGAERATWQIYRRLGAAGAEVRVVGATHGPPHDDPGVTVDDVRGYDLSNIAGGYLAPAPGAFRAGWRAYRELRPHVLHVSTIHYTGCIAAARIAARTGTPLVVTVQLGPLDHIASPIRQMASAYERVVGGYILRRASRVLAVSEAARAHAIALGAAPGITTIAPNGVDHERFGRPPLEAGDDPLVVAVGRLTANKGPDLLVEAAARLAPTHRFRVSLLGDGPMRSTLEARAAALGLDRLRFEGQVPNVDERLGDAEIVVRASYTEGLALAVIEAMAAGRCNVVSDIPPNLELITDGENGLTFRSGDAADLARALGRAIQDPALRERVARRAQLDAQPLTWDNMAAHHADAMLWCVGPR
jgi:glycosyltransferase involved in cell wall biosynthesis